MFTFDTKNNGIIRLVVETGFITEEVLHVCNALAEDGKAAYVDELVTIWEYTIDNLHMFDMLVTFIAGELVRASIMRDTRKIEIAC